MNHLHERAIPTWSPERVRAYLAEHPFARIQLLDVRQATEFQEGHVPGAQLLPVSQLPTRLSVLDPDLLTLVYCRGGIRAAAAVSFLRGAGFDQAYAIEGGILAWDGRTVEGPPDAGMVWFSAARSIDDLIVQVWSFEEGARIYYHNGAARLKGEARLLLADLARDEDHHKASLKALYHRITDRSPEGVFEQAGMPEKMEGGVNLAQALAWMEGKSALAVLEVAMALETTAYDRYVQLERLAQDENARTVFQVLAEGERRHLERISEVFDHLLQRRGDTDAP